MINEWEQLENDPDGFVRKCPYCHMTFKDAEEPDICPNCGADVIHHNAYPASEYSFYVRSNGDLYGTVERKVGNDICGRADEACRIR